MSAEDMIEEARRRSERRAQGKPLFETPAEKVERIQEEDARLEREIQAEVVKLLRAYGCQVYSLSQPRATKQTPGLPDLYVFHPRCSRAFWFETKTPTGKQSAEQETFELNCASTGIAYVLGGVVAAEEKLVEIGAAERTLSGELEPLGVRR